MTLIKAITNGDLTVVSAYAQLMVDVNGLYFVTNSAGNEVLYHGSNEELAVKALQSSLYEQRHWAVFTSPGSGTPGNGCC